MPIDQCCVTPAEMRTIYFQSTSSITQLVYTVPEGKVFVLTAWNLINMGNQLSNYWLLRGTTKVAFNRMWDTVRQHNHLDFDPGVPFAAGEQMLLNGPVSGSAQSIFYGYEQDV